MLRRRGWMLRVARNFFLKNRADKRIKINSGRVLFLLIIRKSTRFYFELRGRMSAWEGRARKNVS